MVAQSRQHQRRNQLLEGACVAPSEVRWVQARVALFPNAATVSRNTLVTGGTNNFDLSVSKLFPIRKPKRAGVR